MTFGNCGGVNWLAHVARTAWQKSRKLRKKAKKEG